MNNNSKKTTLLKKATRTPSLLRKLRQKLSIQVKFENAFFLLVKDNITLIYKKNRIQAASTY